MTYPKPEGTNFNTGRRVPGEVRIVGWVVGLVTLLLCLVQAWWNLPSNPFAILSAVAFLLFGLACIPASRHFIPALRSARATLAAVVVAAAFSGVGSLGTHWVDAEKTKSRHLLYSKVMVRTDEGGVAITVSGERQFVCMDDAFSEISVVGKDGSAQQAVAMHLDDNLNRLMPTASGSFKDERAEWTDILVHGLSALCSEHAGDFKTELTRKYLETQGVQIKP